MVMRVRTDVNQPQTVSKAFTDRDVHRKSFWAAYDKFKLQALPRGDVQVDETQGMIEKSPALSLIFDVLGEVPVLSFVWLKYTSAIWTEIQLRAIS